MHRREGGTREPGRRTAVDLDQAIDPFGWDLRERPVPAEAGIVHQHREPGLPLDRRDDGVDPLVLGQVGDEDARRDAVALTQAFRQGFQSVGASGHEDQVVTGRGEALRVGRADTRGGAGHQRHRAWLGLMVHDLTAASFTAARPSATTQTLKVHRPDLLNRTPPAATTSTTSSSDEDLSRMRSQRSEPMMTASP